MAPIRIQGDAGQFERKGGELRRNRMITLTDTAWARLQEVATKRGVSRSDLIETSAMEGFWSDGLIERSDGLIERMKERMDQVLADETVVRKRDRAAVRRAILALLGRSTTNTGSIR